ncbi:MAG TPA: hypothetical protein VH439_02565 [Gemmatimonadales bacterium]|jgi:hypothetical protein
MAIRRMDHVGIVFGDLAAGIAFFVELDLHLEGETTVEKRYCKLFRTTSVQRPVLCS